MPPTSPVTEFMRVLAQNNSFMVFNDMFGEINLSTEPRITQSSGSVYGIWVQKPSSVPDGVSPIPGHSDWYPVYWGKDISPASRMKAHVQGHKNGNVNLPKRPEIQGCKLIYGAILVARYREFENHLYTVHKPMYGQSMPGRQSTIVKIFGET